VVVVQCLLVSCAHRLSRDTPYPDKRSLLLCIHPLFTPHFSCTHTHPLQQHRDHPLHAVHSDDPLRCSAVLDPPSSLPHLPFPGSTKHEPDNLIRHIPHRESAHSPPLQPRAPPWLLPLARRSTASEPTLALHLLSASAVKSPKPSRPSATMKPTHTPCASPSWHICFSPGRSGSSMLPIPASPSSEALLASTTWSRTSA